MSAAGDALHMLPASVARLRIWTEPTTAAASARAGKCVRTRSSPARSASTVSAVIESRPSARVMAGRSAGMRFRSTTTAGAERPVPEADDQIRAAGEEPGAGAVSLEQGYRLGQRLRALVAESLHGPAPHRTLSTRSSSTWGVAARAK